MGDINVTPMVDVMLVLLIVFMVTAPLLTTGVAVDLPHTESSPLPGQDEPLSVTVDGKGHIFVQDSETQLDQLQARLAAITQRNKDARIFVRGDRANSCGTMMEILGAVGGAGYTHVGLVSSPSDKQAQRKK